MEILYLNTLFKVIRLIMYAKFQQLIQCTVAECRHAVQITYMNRPTLVLQAFIGEQAIVYV